jgi:hypothetical protein
LQNDEENDRRNSFDVLSETISATAKSPGEINRKMIRRNIPRFSASSILAASLPVRQEWKGMGSLQKQRERRVPKHRRK